MRAAFRLLIVLPTSVSSAINLSLKFARALVRAAPPEREHPCPVRWYNIEKSQRKQDEIAQESRGGAKNGVTSGFCVNLQGNFVTLFSARLCIGRALCEETIAVFPSGKFESDIRCLLNLYFKRSIHGIWNNIFYLATFLLSCFFFSSSSSSSSHHR